MYTRGHLEQRIKKGKLGGDTFQYIQRYSWIFFSLAIGPDYSIYDFAVEGQSCYLPSL